MKPVGLPAPVLFLRDLFGGDFDTLDGEVVVPAGGIQLVGGDPEAVALTFINLGTDIVFLRPKNPAAANAGIVLSPGGGSISLIVRDDGTLPTFNWWAFPNTAGQTVYFLRLSRYTNLDRNV